MNCKKILLWVISLTVVLIAVSIGILHYLSRPVTKGTIFLDNAKGEATIYRETKTSIPHVYASSELMAVYTEGFLHAQDRLWQLEKVRRLSQGRMSEVFGDKAIGLDKFFRTIGIHKIAQEAVQHLSKEHYQILQAYADGINDFVKSIHLTKPDASAAMLPPEFIALGIKDLDPWTPVDSICVLRLMNLNLSWNWGQDSMREILRLSGLGDLVEEIYPFTAEFSHNLVTIIDKEDIMGTKHWSDETILEKYHKSQGKTQQTQKAEIKEKPTKQEIKTQQQKQQKQEPKEKKKEQEKRKKEEEFAEQVHLDEALASNNWVIHGNYTKTGKPLLASDPHLSNGIPSHWYLLEMNFDGHNIIGSSHPGMPLLTFGKTRYVTWGITAAITDVSDLFQEKLNEERSKYFVDGQWRDLQVRTEFIKVKSQEMPIKFEVKSTHRGPIIDKSLLGYIEILLSEGFPISEEMGDYSFQWAGQVGKENYLTFLRELTYSKNIHDYYAAIEKIEEYDTVPQNLVLAYDSGDIGYLLGSKLPIRKHQRPYTGCRVLDGTTTENDWIGYLKPKDLPKIINPKKGFVVTANNRQLPENYKTHSDGGATLTSTARAQRITELIQEQINRGEKFDVHDMMRIQNDTVDIVAKNFVPKIINLAQSQLSLLDHKQQEQVSYLLDRLRFWNGDMSLESVPATIYSTWYFFLFSRFLSDYIPDESTRVTMTANPPFIDCFQRLILALESNPHDDHFNKICQGSYKQYKGNQPCMYQIARAFVEAYEFLTEHYSKDSENWKWGYVHTNDYMHTPFSLTPLKPLFHREIAIGGNQNTAKVSKYSMRKFAQTKQFKSTHTPNYKHVVQFADNDEDEVMYYSVDMGQSGNLFAGHYSDFMRNHAEGRLLRAYEGKAQLEQVKYDTLIIKPTSSLKSNKKQTNQKENNGQDL